MHKQQSISQKVTYWIKVVSLGMILGLGLQFAQAWTAPKQAPPLGNVGGPITTGNSPQVKGDGLVTEGSLLTLNGILDMVSHRITGVADPIAPQDVATKAYVDASAGYVRGGHYGSCIQQWDAGFTPEWSGEKRYPMTTCTNARLVCDAGFTVTLATVPTQMNTNGSGTVGGAANITTMIKKFNAFLDGDHYWVSYDCVKD